MDLACYYVLDGNTFKEIKREVGCSFCGAAHFLFSAFVVAPIYLELRSIYLKNRRYNFIYRFNMSLIFKVVKAKLTSTPFLYYKSVR